MTRLFAAAALVLSTTAVVYADGDDPATAARIETFDPDAAVAPVSVVEGPGIKVGEGTVLRPVIGIETGFISNVFYSDTDPKAAGVLRILAQIGTGSYSNDRLAPSETDGGGDVESGALRFRADVRASYDAILSGNDNATSSGGLGLGASLHGLINPKGPVSFGFDDDFVRMIRAANFETDSNTNRDINRLQLSLNLKPNGSALSGSLYYNNTIDIFERDEQQFADRIEHRGGIRAAWQFFPRSQLYVDASLGFVSGLGDDAQQIKSDSYPLIAKAGIATLLSASLSINAEAGYTNGFYSNGPSFSAPLINAQIAYRYSPLGRAAIGYSLNYQDSINANYYRDHIIRLWLRQIVSPVVFMVQPEVHFRQYAGINPMLIQGPATRDDVILSVIAGVSYNFRSWIAATANYRFTDVSTDYEYMSGGVLDDPGYARHELLVGMRAAF